MLHISQISRSIAYNVDLFDGQSVMYDSPLVVVQQLYESEICHCIFFFAWVSRLVVAVSWRHELV